MYLEDFMKPLPIFLLSLQVLDANFHHLFILPSISRVGKRERRRFRRGGGDPTDVGLSV